MFEQSRENSMYFKTVQIMSARALCEHDGFDKINLRDISTWTASTAEPASRLSIDSNPFGIVAGAMDVLKKMRLHYVYEIGVCSEMNGSCTVTGLTLGMGRK